MAIMAYLLKEYSNDEDYEKFYTAALRDVEEAKKTREYGLDTTNHPNWFDASNISWLSYDSLHLELPDGILYFAPIIKNWNIKPEEMEKVIGQSFDDIYANWVIWNTNQFQESGL